MNIAFTGHRPPKLENDYNLTSPLIKKIESRILNIIEELSLLEGTYKSVMFITGMALGIDTLVAQVAIRINNPFIAAIPCIGQWSKWPKKSVDVYDKILANPLCTKYLVSNRAYFDGCMDIRNKWMIDQLKGKEDRLISVWDGSSGGTANCVKYAENTIGKERIININPKHI